MAQSPVYVRAPGSPALTSPGVKAVLAAGARVAGSESGRGGRGGPAAPHQHIGRVAQKTRIGTIRRSIHMPHLNDARTLVSSVSVATLSVDPTSIPGRRAHASRARGAETSGAILGEAHETLLSTCIAPHRTLSAIDSDYTLGATTRSARNCGGAPGLGCCRRCLERIGLECRAVEKVFTETV